MLVFARKRVVREMLVAGAGGLTPEMVAEASTVTVVKSAAYMASLIALGVIVAVMIILAWVMMSTDPQKRKRKTRAQHNPYE